MVVGVGRTLRLGQRVLDQLLKNDLDRPVRLGIFYLPHELGVMLHF